MTPCTHRCPVPAIWLVSIYKVLALGFPTQLLSPCRWAFRSSAHNLLNVIKKLSGAFHRAVTGVTMEWQSPHPVGTPDPRGVRPWVAFKVAFMNRLGGGAEDMLPSRLLPFTSAFDKTLLQRKTLKFTEPCFWEQCAVPSCRGMVLVKHGLLEKCLGKGLRGSKLFITQGTASNARCQQDQGSACR